MGLKKRMDRLAWLLLLLCLIVTFVLACVYHIVVGPCWRSRP
jgi:hypothetical protein